MSRKDRRAEAARQRHAKAMVGMELRYGGRTLVVTAYVNTSEDSGDVVKRVQPAARGPKQAMAIVTAGVHEAALTAALWRSQDIPTMFGGRTVVVTCYVNTDEDPQAVSTRVMCAANSPTDPMVRAECQGQLPVITTVGESPAEATGPTWEKFFAMLRAQKDGPN
jgi:hypothetical protein